MNAESVFQDLKNISAGLLNMMSASGLKQSIAAPKVAAEDCQVWKNLGCGRVRTPSLVYISRKCYVRVREEGPVQTLRWMAGAIATLLGRKPKGGISPAIENEVLNLQPGEWVQVKSLEEIKKTLDRNRKTRGLTFHPDKMAQYCGREYRVFKRLELMFNEYSRQQRQIRNTVLLEGVFCQGEGIGCDRSCFHYWREAWLRRVEPVAPHDGATGRQY